MARSGKLTWRVLLLALNYCEMPIQQLQDPHRRVYQPLVMMFAQEGVAVKEVKQVLHWVRRQPYSFA